MQKTILITGSTDGIGLETAKQLASQGHKVLLHGRSKSKLDKAEKMLSESANNVVVESYLADLSNLSEVESMAAAVKQDHQKLDILINNAGIFKAPETVTNDGLDIRFVVNTLAPYLLTQKLLSIIQADGRVINLSSAAQSPVNPDAVSGRVRLTDDFDAYAQSKLAITMWSRVMGLQLKEQGPLVIAVNPGSLLATKMVKEGFGMPGHDIQVGVDILIRAALSDEFATATAEYFDNDSGGFAAPHVDALNVKKSEEIVNIIEAVLAGVSKA